jgi:hypothetical protein
VVVRFRRMLHRSGCRAQPAAVGLSTLKMVWHSSVSSQRVVTTSMGLALASGLRTCSRC